MFLRIPGGKYDIKDISFNLFIHVNFLDDIFGFQDIIRLHYGCSSGKLLSYVLPDDELFLIPGRIIDDHFQHKTIYLRFRQGVCSFLFYGVLGSKDHKWPFQFISVFAYGNLLLLHGFKQGTLYFCWRTVDLICKDKIGKDRPLLNFELFLLHAIDHRTYQVSR